MNADDRLWVSADPADRPRRAMLLGMGGGGLVGATTGSVAAGVEGTVAGLIFGALVGVLVGLVAALALRVVGSWTSTRSVVGGTGALVGLLPGVPLFVGWNGADLSARSDLALAAAVVGVAALGYRCAQLATFGIEDRRRPGPGPGTVMTRVLAIGAVAGGVLGVAGGIVDAAIGYSAAVIPVVGLVGVLMGVAAAVAVLMAAMVLLVRVRR